MDVDWFMAFSQEFIILEKALRDLSVYVGVILIVACLLNFIAKKRNPHKEDVSLLALFGQMACCVLLMSLDMSLELGSSSVFGSSETAEVGDYLVDMEATDPQVAFNAALLAGASLIGRFFGFLAFINAYSAAQENNDLERKRLRRKAINRYVAGVGFVQFPRLIRMGQESSGVDFSVTARSELGWIVENAHVLLI